ncbi:protein of unknown function (DUF4440) [Cyclonatronum proteinivorum]|uniref:DUF4440 domain-containing protein n=1 Tax=Cyclonatronum proteinivorum TaxID=1457365 RepID=A0A345UKD1_9BACT|nr:nuclear transport factor 2 family protein [Cyclonatronum proteinivorum]AXJ00933.1 protein of unknown function (DUF4440) [Cyclonatronum proteinivorum]
MRSLTAVLFPLALLLSLNKTDSIQAQPISDSDAASAEIASLLDQFLEGAARSDAEIHDRFWHESLIYTSSAGIRFGKADLMSGLNPLPSDTEPELFYHAEEVHIRFVENLAVLHFTLVATDGETESRFLNSGILMQEEGQWQVISWQATVKASEP